MATTKTDTRKVHLKRPTNEKRQMCGREVGLDTDKPAKVTCLSCKKMYETNKKWYSATKRKQTMAAKKA